ncbi:glycosyltransferase family 2 protein [Halalkalicoccus jeotgali]|uniref:Family 2 glycosyl transferase n=1 Tax=Halalkalicoccus jeotgali (strain DSM 18796 / CECT 7217 / JCM 14584 / KCTC 4019 / B3) TaxID=795797 RepID=D8J8I5_HALJB|nr:glycosyltransferase family A protein [Halalkalicoccus jeotgali]ADJ16231.1 glycosyl transferase family 2 [Halalkalicoccus jeotgali B3]ELY37306.1 family 2 glycosyl transferase [Halalkalicoccus jeotgali B3]
MELSVVVPTLNGRRQLVGCLDALRERLPAVETIVVNGPSTDGTSGMVHERPDVDVLVEIADRNINVARNAGLEVASGEVVALLDQDHRIEDGWAGAIEAGIAGNDIDAVTGPTHRPIRGGHTTEARERRTIAGREVTYFNGGNVALTRAVLDELDGFDEYLETGGARDLAHRLAGQGRAVSWQSAMGVREGVETDGGDDTDPRIVHRASSFIGSEASQRWGLKYRALAYRLAKNYGPRPTVLRRLVGHTAADGVTSARSVLRGSVRPTAWVGGGSAVTANTLVGLKDGLRARVSDRTPRRNPHGISGRRDRAIERYDWR